ERLQKVLAAAGAGSRRQCEELIETGRVEVDRCVVTELGTRVDPSTQEIRLDGTVLPKVKLVCFALNKPTGVVSTNRDPSGRPRVIDIIESHGMRLFTIGRLDMNSEGLILVTNDGALADRLTHPRYGVEKIYRVQVAGRPTREALAEVRQGVYLAEGFARVTGLEVKSHHKASTILEMVLREGRNREIRRVLARVGHKVQRLVRIAIGPIRLGDLQPGESRMLTSQEINALRREADPKKPGRKKTTHKTTARKGTARKKVVRKKIFGDKPAGEGTARKKTARKETVGKKAATKRPAGKGASRAESPRSPKKTAKRTPKRGPAAKGRKPIRGSKK
ncbi:MAG TPA: pseudouridine synthase, partial [Thermoguttaceae bacterium]|nr:pseudouridine synthase [Thermoguttaceae bacterium]